MCYSEDTEKRFCLYCKETIEDNETCISNGTDNYHVECYNQMNLYMDDFGDVIRYEDEDII